MPRKVKLRLRRGCCQSVMHGTRTAEDSGYSPLLSFELLGEHVSTERNAALESHRREIGALPSFGFRPGKQRRNESSHAGAHKPQESKVGSMAWIPLRSSGRSGPRCR